MHLAVKFSDAQRWVKQRLTPLLGIGVTEKLIDKNTRDGIVW